MKMRSYSDLFMAKKMIAYMAIFLLSVGMVTAASLSRSMPARVSPGEEVTVSFSISSMDVGKEAGVSEVVPNEISVKEQSVTGASGTPTYEVADGNNHKWSFEASSSSPTVTYKFNAPNEVGNYDFDAVYVLPPASIDNIKSTLTVRVITCGDGICEGSENSDSCETDCPKPAPPPVKEEVEEEAGLSTGLIIIVVIVVLGLIAYFVIKKKRQY